MQDRGSCAPGISMTQMSSSHALCEFLHRTKHAFPKVSCLAISRGKNGMQDTQEKVKHKNEHCYGVFRHRQKSGVTSASLPTLKWAHRPGLSITVSRRSITGKNVDERLSFSALLKVHAKARSTTGRSHRTVGQDTYD